MKNGLGNADCGLRIAECGMKKGAGNADCGMRIEIEEERRQRARGII
jgi:hypothetical protein